MALVSVLVPIILKWEGGFQNYKEDSGNYLNGVLIGTNKGVTPAAYKTAFGKTPREQDMRALTDAQFMQVLKTLYWDKWRADSIADQKIANLLVDWVWASGVWGIKIPQRLLGLAEDGVVGEKTVAAINQFADKRKLHQMIIDARISFVEDLCKNKPQNAKFRQGWINRINSFKY